MEREGGEGGIVMTKYMDAWITNKTIQLIIFRKSESQAQASKL